MVDLAPLPPRRRPELLVGPVGDRRFAVVDPRSGETYQLGEEEAFLFSRLDGQHTCEEICGAFNHRFGTPLTPNEFQEFVELARANGFLQVPANGAVPAASADEIPAYESRFAASRPIYQRAQRVIAGFTTHDRRDFGPFPVYVTDADRACKWDVAGNRLIDYWMGHGALLCGHNFPPVVAALKRQADLGTHYGACHELEVRWAELVQQLIPSAERVRFTASGTEATQLALRVARAWTGRPLLVKFRGHFHGWHDEALAHFFPTDEAGINPAATAQVTVAETDSLDAALALLEKKQVAGVILEPGGGGAGALPWSADLLRTLRQATRDYGSLLIFDEVISGFRQSPGGVQQVTGVIPDLTTLAKILCGGLPGGAVVGRADVMAVFGQGTRPHPAPISAATGPAAGVNRPVYTGRSPSREEDRFARVPHTGTFNGNPLSAAAGIALLEHLADGRPQRQAQAAAHRLVTLVNQAADAHRVDVCLYTNGTSVYHILIGARATGQPLGPSPAVTALQYSHPERYARLRRALLLEGVDTNNLHGWVSAVHDADLIEETARAFDRAFHRLRSADGFRL